MRYQAHCVARPVSKFIYALYTKCPATAMHKIWTLDTMGKTVYFLQNKYKYTLPKTEVPNKTQESLKSLIYNCNLSRKMVIFIR